MTPKETVINWVHAFNAADIAALEQLYDIAALNHQMPGTPVTGRTEIGNMFREEFAKLDMHCIIMHIFEDGEWAIMEWKDPKGFRGCGFFHVVNGLIQVQRGYWDKLSFFRLYNLQEWS